MSTIDLMLLGALMKQPMNAYEIKKVMEYRKIKSWIKISSPSVYKNLVKLYKSGFLDGQMVREGEMPEKMIYTVNDKGKKYFMQLMQKYSEEPGVLHIDFSAFIANLSYVDRETGLKMIENLQNSLVHQRDVIKEEISKKINRASFYGMATIELHLQTYTLFCEWAEKFKRQYSENTENTEKN
jgi:DNA-binding PadR family transcriptional regulator